MQACGGDQAEAISFIKPEPAPEVSAVTRTTGQDTIDPNTVANDAAVAWRKVWGVKGAVVNVTDKAGMQELMTSSVRDGHWKRECSVPPLTAERVRKAMRSGGGKGIGADGWTKEELKFLPDEAAEALLRAYSAVEAEGAFPPQARLTLESLIPKAAKPNERDPGNLRNLGITPVLYRTWARARVPELKRWHAGLQDTRLWGDRRRRGGPSKRRGAQDYGPKRLSPEDCARAPSSSIAPRPTKRSLTRTCQRSWTRWLSRNQWGR